jgi:hypothetical protein
LISFLYCGSNVGEINKSRLFSAISFEILYDSLVYVSHKLGRNYLESMMVESPTMPEYAKYLSSYAVFIVSISAHPTPIPQIHLCSPLHRLIRITTRGVMEILGLDPYQSETQYLEGFLREVAQWRQSGCLSPPCLLSVSTIDRRSERSGYKVETKRIHVSTIKLPIYN